jgi:hypothetical protein
VSARTCVAHRSPHPYGSTGSVTSRKTSSFAVVNRALASACKKSRRPKSCSRMSDAAGRALKNAGSFGANASAPAPVATSRPNPRPSIARHSTSTFVDHAPPFDP